MSGDCPDENVLSAYAGRTLDRETRVVVEEHLDRCMTCLAVLSAVAAMAKAGGSGSEASDHATGDEAPLVRGSVVGRYTVVAMIGQGGMGTVYRAHDPQLDRQVALKVLRGSRLAARLRSRMIREARLMARLAHPSIVTVFDAGETDARTYIAMELLEGETLGSWLAREKPSLPAILERFAAAGHALVAAHAAGIVHRDFKPENVLIGASGRVAVSDFGIAAATAAEGEEGSGDGQRGAEALQLTHTGALLGTPGYMSPEQYRRERVGAASDQFSFAVALWQAVYGQAPFRGDTFHARREAVLAHQLRPLDEARRREVPPRLHRALLRALADDPRERFPALDDLLSKLSAVASPARRWSRVLAASGGALLLGAAVTLGLAARGGRERPTFPEPAASAPPGGDAPTPSHARTAVVLLASDNETGDARYDGVVEGAIEELVNASRKLDAYGAAVHDPDHRAVVTVRSAITRSQASDDAAAGSVVVTLAPTDAVSGKSLPVLRAIAAPGEPLMPTLHRLSLDLRAELGDGITPAADEPVVMSESLEALHEWATGVGLGRAGDHAAAIPHLRRAIAADPSFAEAHATLASAIFNSSFVVEDAEKEVALALGGPTRRMSTRRRMMTLAFSYGYQHRSAEQMSVVQQVLDFWPGDFPAEVLITTAAASAGERSLALEFARRAAADHPDAQIVHHNLLSALLHQELLPEAETEGEELLRRFPQSGAFSYALLAIVQTLLAEPEKASATCDRLALVDPELADELRADMAAYAGKPDEAIARLHRRIDPAVAKGDTEEVATEYAALAPLLVARGDRVRAKAALKVALGGEIDMQYDAARRLVALGDEERAPAFVAGWSDATDPLARMYARLLRGDLLLQHGKIEDASASYRLALQIEDAWIVHARLADAALAAQDWKTAESELAICRARRGDGATALTPSLRLVRVVDEELALVRQHVVPAR